MIFVLYIIGSLIFISICIWLAIECFDAALNDDATPSDVTIHLCGCIALVIIAFLIPLGVGLLIPRPNQKEKAEESTKIVEEYEYCPYCGHQLEKEK